MADQTSPDAAARWREQRRAAAAAHGELLAERQRAESARAQELIDAFLVRVARLRTAARRSSRARSYDGRARYRTPLTGWYLRRDETRRRSTPPASSTCSRRRPSLAARFRGVTPEPSDPPWSSARAARTASRSTCRDALARVLGAADAPAERVAVSRASGAARPRAGPGRPGRPRPRRAARSRPRCPACGTTTSRASGGRRDHVLGGLDRGDRVLVADDDHHRAAERARARRCGRGARPSPAATRRRPAGSCCSIQAATSSATSGRRPGWSPPASDDAIGRTGVDRAGRLDLVRDAQPVGVRLRGVGGRLGVDQAEAGDEVRVRARAARAPRSRPSTGRRPPRARCRRRARATATSSADASSAGSGRSVGAARRARQVDGEHRAARRDRRRDGVPHPVVEREAVQQDDAEARRRPAR